MQDTVVGYQLVKTTTSFTRPTDTNAYAIGDCISNSTSAPVPFELSIPELTSGTGSIEIRKIAVISSVKQSTLPLINVYLSPTTFTSTNDNDALSIADSNQENGGTWALCDLQNYTAVNSRCAYSGAALPLVLEGQKKLYGVLQAANAYTPANGEKFTIVAWIAVL